MLWTAPRESIQRGMQVPTRPTRKKSTSYWTSLQGLGLQRMRVVLGFVACWRWRAKARFSGCLKGLLMGKSLIDCADHTDSDTTRFLFQRLSNELLASLGLPKKIKEATGLA